MKKNKIKPSEYWRGGSAYKTAVEKWLLAEKTAVVVLWALGAEKEARTIEDRRPGQVADPGFLNANGCWVYSGMNGNAHPGCGPSDPNWTYLNALIGGNC